jgi:hypothetical protein
MTEDTTKIVIFCPGCGRRKPSEEDKHDYTCCNPRCVGEWEEGCYHCHSPDLWPHPLFHVTALRKGRRFTSFVRVSGFVSAPPPFQQEEALLKAAKQFVGKLAQVLLLESGLRWTIVVRVIGGSGQTRTYSCFALGATIMFEDKTGIPDEMNEDKPDTHEEDLKYILGVAIPADEPLLIADAEKPSEPRMTRDQAKEALEVYVRQQIEAEAINLLEDLVGHIANHAHELHRSNCRVSIGAIPVDQMYTEMLEHAQAMGLSSPKPPEWVGRILTLIQQIRVERGILKPAPPPEPQCHDLPPYQRAYNDPFGRGR